MIYPFVALEAICSERSAESGADHRSLLVSLNPDLVSDFGHFLNYERRLREECVAAGIGYACFANRKVKIDDASLTPVFDQDSGHYSLARNSTSGEEEEVALEFFETVTANLQGIQGQGQFDTVWLFLYCGSSRLASRLCDLPWDPRIRLCINAFWDFLLPSDEYRHLSRLSFQRSIRLLAMSELHRQCILDATGLDFDAIPNPSPLMGDAQAYDAIRSQVPASPPGTAPKVLIPGLMTLGKGKESTVDLFNHLRKHPLSEATFVFRDRSSHLEGHKPANTTVIAGDLTDAQVIDLYRSSHIAVLPYEPKTFGVRTSGALVDCLVFGVVPLVVRGTWLAHVCESLDMGRVLPNMSPRAVIDAVRAIAASLAHEQSRVFRGAVRYLAANSWGRLMSTVVGDRDAGPPPPPLVQPVIDASLFSAANRLFREGRYEGAARLYHWLSTMSDLGVYRSNLALCELKSGRPAHELLRETQ